MDRWRPNLEDSVDEMLSSALVAQEQGARPPSAGGGKSFQEPEVRGAGHPSSQQHPSAHLLCAVKHSLLDRELRSLALTDDLTCLYKPACLPGFGGQQLRVARRNGQGLLLFFADVNNLKEINDTYGHQGGDLAIIRTADAPWSRLSVIPTLLPALVEMSLPYCTEASCENREVILRRLEKNLKGSNADESRYELSLSVGVSRFDPKHPVSLGKLIATADEAMYEDKKMRPKLCSAR